MSPQSRRRYENHYLGKTMNEENSETTADLIGLTTEIVAAYVSNNSIPRAELLRLIADSHAAIVGLVSADVPKQAEKSLSQRSPSANPWLPRGGFMIN